MHIFPLTGLVLVFWIAIVNFNNPIPCCESPKPWLFGIQIQDKALLSFFCSIWRGPSFAVHHPKSYTWPESRSVNEYSPILYKFKARRMLLVMFNIRRVKLNKISRLKFNKWLAKCLAFGFEFFHEVRFSMHPFSLIWCQRV